MAAAPMFRRILCAVDFSPSSVIALAQARVIADENDAHLFVLHVLEGFPNEAVYSAGRAARLIGHLEGRVDELTRRLRALMPADGREDRVEFFTVSGDASKAIVAAAAERNADLIVIGPSERKRLDHIVSGSTVKAVVRHAHCAVLVTAHPRP